MCSRLRALNIHIGISDYFDTPAGTQNQQKFDNIVKNIQVNNMLASWL